MKRKTTMQDIANMLGVTKVSVSKALNNQPGVSDTLRRRIIETAEASGYIMNKPIGQNDKRRFVFVVPKRFFLETDKFYNVIFYYLNKICMNTGHQLTSIVLNQKSEEEAHGLDTIHPDPIDGIFLAGEVSDKYIQMLSCTGIPIVAIDFYKNYLDVDYILIDNFYLSYYATSYLIDKGHKDIGFVGNVNQTSSINDRYYGFLKAMQSNGLPVRSEWMISNNDSKTGLYAIDITFPKQLPTAFVCHCDMAAYFLMNSLKSIDKTVPDDVSIISFDNTELSRTVTPKLSSVDINKKEIAETAFQIMEKINHGEKHRHRYYISTKLVERDSVKAINTTTELCCNVNQQ